MQGYLLQASLAFTLALFACLTAPGVGDGQGGGEGNAPDSARGRHAAAALHIAKAGIVWTDVLMDVCLPYLLESSLLVRCDIISRFYEVKSNRMKKAVKRQSYSRSKRKYSCIL